jgi:hypothetical protein
MSPDRTTITRAEAIRRRKEEEQKRQEKLAPKKIKVPQTRPAEKPKLKPIASSRPAAAPETERMAPRIFSPATKSRVRDRYDIAMSTPYGRTESYNLPKAPAISLPKVGLGPRLLSFLIAALCATGLYYLSSLDPFIVRNSNILGNQRITTEQIASVLGVANQPAALLNPAQIEYNILATFPDLSAAQVEVNLPAEVVVTVSERQPVVAWLQDGQTTWVDGLGYGFPPRGQVDGLVTVTAAGAPPTPANVNLAQTIGARPFLTADLSETILTLAPHLPQGAALIFDPGYGLGWSDPAGWKVYFGHSNGDAELKFRVYQAMVDYLTQHEIQPSLISVEYPDAPFYRMEQ